MRTKLATAFAAIALALTMFASNANATPCIGPWFDASHFSAAPTSVEVGDAVTFTGLMEFHGGNGCGTYTPPHYLLHFYFGDGQDFQSTNFGATIEHNYITEGTFTALLLISGRVDNWTHITNPNDCSLDYSLCQTLSAPTGATFSQSFNIVAHAPEPATYAMLLAGLGLMAFAARQRKAVRA